MNIETTPACDLEVLHDAFVADLGGTRNTETLPFSLPLSDILGRQSACGFSPATASIFATIIEGRTRIASDAQGLAAVGRLRFLGFQDRNYADAHGDAESFLEAVDQCSLNFYVGEFDALKAVLRLTKATEMAGDAQLTRLVDMHQHASWFDRTRLVICSRFVQVRRAASVGAIVELFRSIYACELLAGAESCLLETRASNVPIFEKFGFEPTGIIIDDDRAGQLISMVLHLRDYEGLRARRSPLSALVDRILTGTKNKQAPLEAAEWGQKGFSNAYRERIDRFIRNGEDRQMY